VVFEVAPGHPWHRAGEVVRDMSPCFRRQASACGGAGVSYKARESGKWFLLAVSACRVW